MATEFNFYDEEFQNNPALKYAEMLDECPFHLETQE